MIQKDYMSERNRVIVIERNPLWQKAVLGLLAELDCDDAGTASSIEEANQLIQKKGPDEVTHFILNPNLSEGVFTAEDGAELLAKIRDKFAAAIVIGLSASTPPEGLNAQVAMNLNFRNNLKFLLTGEGSFSS